MFTADGFNPPPRTPRVGDATAPRGYSRASIVSPKSTAFPIDAIVIKSITLVSLGLFPAKIRPRVEFEQD